MEAHLKTERERFHYEKDALQTQQKVQSDSFSDENTRLKNELKILQSEASYHKAQAAMWEDKYKSAAAALASKPKDPTCDEATLRALISFEVLRQLREALGETAMCKSRMESAEIQVKTLIDSIANLNSNPTDMSSYRSLLSRSSGSFRFSDHMTMSTTNIVDLHPNFRRSTSSLDPMIERRAEEYESLMEIYQDELDAYDSKIEEKKRLHVKKQREKRLEERKLRLSNVDEDMAMEVHNLSELNI